MYIKTIRKCILFLLLVPVGLLFQTPLQAQTQNCVFKDPLVVIDFGNNIHQKDVNLSMIPNYDRTGSSCPDDGSYSFTSLADDCFGGHWHRLLSDHTPGDTEGRMMIVNASYTPGPFFMLNIAGLKAGTTYQFANWIMNVCDPNDECTSIYPLIKVSILSGGRLLSSFTTGEIAPSPEPQWKKYVAQFTLPKDVSSITLQMEDLNPGGCGNDFAMDDITLQECVLPPVSTREPAAKKVTSEKTASRPTPAQPVKKTASPPVRVTPTEEVTIKKIPSTEKPVNIQSGKKEVNKIVAVPRAILNRQNPLIKRILSEASQLVIELYDNGQIDGDTVSIYHNNQLIKSKAGLSEKPLTINITLDEQQPHHELIMVAENLGSIPPNTSLMIITAKNKRFEVFISSSEQKNAKIVIDLKE